MKPIRVLVVDESSRWGEAIRRSLDGTDDIIPVAVTPSSSAGLDQALKVRPQLVVLSVETPGLSPADFTRKALAGIPHLGILLTARNGVDCEDLVIEALEAGAFDLILKPDVRGKGSCGDDVMARRLLPKIRSFSAALYSRLARKLSGSNQKITRPVSDGTRRRAIDAIRNGNGRSGIRPELIVVGVSTGGPEALSHMLPALPRDLKVPMVIVQHMPERFLFTLANALHRRSQIRVKVAEHREPLRGGSVYFAPGGHQMKLARDRKGLLTCRLTDDPPESGFRPSADVLFRSAARTSGGNTIALLLTGMGGDGASGLADLKRAGAVAIAQDEESSVVWGMPGRAVRSDLIDEILPLTKIAGRLAEWLDQ